MLDRCKSVQHAESVPRQIPAKGGMYKTSIEQHGTDTRYCRVPLPLPDVRYVRNLQPKALVWFEAKGFVSRAVLLVLVVEFP